MTTTVIDFAMFPPRLSLLSVTGEQLMATDSLMKVAERAINLL
jgi:hypothetical protein